MNTLRQPTRWLLGVKVISNEPDFMGTLMITLILQPSSSFHTKWRGNKHVTESNFLKVVAKKNRERIAETRMHMQAAIICCSPIFLWYRSCLQHECVSGLFLNVCVSYF